MLAVAPGPIFRSSLADYILAWNDCADAVEGNDFKVNAAALEAKGWRVSAIDAKTKIIKVKGLYTKEGMTALIDISGPSCIVEGLFSDASGDAQIEAKILERTELIAKKRGVKAQHWITDGSPRYSARPFTVVLEHPSNGYVKLLSGSLDNTFVVRILTVDPYRSKK